MSNRSKAITSKEVMVNPYSRIRKAGALPNTSKKKSFFSSLLKFFKRSKIEKTTPKMVSYVFDPEPKVRKPLYDYVSLFEMSRTSWVLRQIFRAIIGEVLNPRWSIVPRFRLKCKKCEREYSSLVEECECGSREFIKPDYEQYKKFKRLIEKPNRDYNLVDLFRSTLWYDLALDDFYWGIAYREEVKKGVGIVRVPAEIYVEDARFIFPVMDEYGHLGNNEYFCPRCYELSEGDQYWRLEELEDKINPKCPLCGRPLIQTCYVQEINGQIVARFGRDEIVHGSSSRVLPEAFGNSKLISVWKLLAVLEAMDDYNWELYSEGHSGSLVVFPGHDQNEITALKEAIEREIKEKDLRDIQTGKRKYSKKIRTHFIGVKEPPIRIPIMEDFEKMQSLDFYKLYAEKICFTARTPILTEDGWKPIYKVKVGERVLTHKGNWKRVVRKYERISNEGSIDIFISGNFKDYRNYKISPTPNHPILTDKGWKRAEDLTEDDKIAVIGSYCKVCGKPTTLGSRYCSNVCRNLDRDYSKIEKSLSEHKRVSPKERKFVLERDNYTCQVCGARVATSQHDYEIHHIIPVELGGHPSDPNNLITLCRKCHQKEHVIIRLAIPKLKELGLLEKYNSAYEHGMFSILYRPILKLKRNHWKRTMKVYNLEVEDDNSYIAGGVIVHNCAVFGVTPMFVSVVEATRAGVNPRMQIDVQNRTTRRYQRDIEDLWNEEVLPKFGITDWVLKFNSIEGRDILREAQTEHRIAATAMTWRLAGFDVEVTEDKRLIVSAKPVRPVGRRVPVSTVGEGKIPRAARIPSYETTTEEARIEAMITPEDEEEEK